MEVLSLVVGVVSIALAVVAIRLSYSWSVQSRQSEERSREVLAQVEQQTAKIEDKVSKNFEDMLETLRDQIRRAYPEPPSVETQLGVQFMGQLLERMTPEQMLGLIERFGNRGGDRPEE